MRRTSVGLALASGILSLGLPTLRAQEPAKPETLPPPRTAAPVPGEPVTLVPLTGYYRTSRYDVWQFYGVDRQGYFRPRVISSPFGSYYLYNGKPYPWETVQPRNRLLQVVD